MQCAPPAPKSATTLLRDRMEPAPASPTLPHATLSEVFAAREVNPAADGAVTSFVSTHLSGEKPVLWILDRLTRAEAGVPYLTGMAQTGLKAPILRLDLNNPRDVLWAAEQALSCSALQGVVAELWGDPQVLDFTATKRLALRAEAHGVACWLVRRGGQASLSAARERWRVTSLASLRHPHDPRAPGHPLWRADLFRSRFRPPQAWVARHDAAEGLVLDHARLDESDTGPTTVARRA